MYDLDTHATKTLGMKGSFVMSTAPLMLLFLFLGLSSPSAERMPSDPVKSRANYESVVAHLDTGGDLIIAANTDGVVENIAAGLRAWTEMLPRGAFDENARKVFDQLPAFITSSGFYAVDGFGMSLLPVGDGVNTLKIFVRRDPAAAELPLWRAMVGGAPRALTSLNYLPADTVLARLCGGEPDQLFKLVADAVQQVGGADASEEWEKALTQADKALGTSAKALIASLGSDAFLSIQLSTTESLSIPLPGGRQAENAEPLTIPLPSLLIGTAVRDATLLDTVRRLVAGTQAPCVTSQVDGVTLISVPIPDAAPYPLNPTFAVHKGMFLFGTTPDVVKSAISAAVALDGLRNTPAFKRDFARFPATHNGLSFIDRRFTESFAKVKTALLQSVGGRGNFGAMGVPLLGTDSGSHLLVIVNEKDGIAISGTTSDSALQTLRCMAIIPMTATIGSAVAIPSMMRARRTAVNYSCINNLRMFDSAKEQWAMAEAKNEGAEPVVPEVLQYIKGAAMPVCPQGGHYTLGVIGQPPTCSHPGHALP